MTSRQCHLCASTPCRCRVDYFAPLQLVSPDFVARLEAERQRPTPRFDPQAARERAGEAV